MRYINSRFTLHYITSCIDVRRLALQHVDTSPDVHVHACVQNASTYGAVSKVYASHARSKTPLIWRKPYHVTNSSYVIGHLLHTLRCLHYMRCIACVRLETALDVGCQCREDVVVEWSKCRSSNAVLKGAMVSCRGRLADISRPFKWPSEIIIASALLLNARHVGL